MTSTPDDDDRWRPPEALTAAASSSRRDDADDPFAGPVAEGGSDAGRAGRTERARGAARKVGHGARVSARGFSRAGKAAVATARKAAGAQGAKDSGLNRLIEMHAFNTAGDAAVAIALAGSLFFSMPGTGGESSREQVALFLVMTMLPFAFVAPLLGPFLDRFAHGRRWAIGGTMAIRAFLAWVLAGALTTQSPVMFPAALGVLVMSKAYGTTRAAAVPRLLPEGFTLVKGNGRVSMSGMAGVAVSAPLAGLCALAGSDWVLRYAAVLFAVATVLAILLPAKIDQSEGEGTMSFRTETGPEEDTTTLPGPRGTRPNRLRMRMPPAVAYAMRANCAPKFLYGFLLMFFAFLLQEKPINDWNPTILLGLVAGAAAAGNFLGVVAASLLKRISPQITVTAVVVLDVAAALCCALFYGLASAMVLGLVTGLGASLAKFALDSTIQRDVPTRVHTSAFARSDTTLQLAWVLGGFIGIVLPLNPTLALWIVTAILGSWAVFVLTAPRPKVTADTA